MSEKQKEQIVGAFTIDNENDENDLFAWKLRILIINELEKKAILVTESSDEMILFLKVAFKTNVIKNRSLLEDGWPASSVKWFIKDTEIFKPLEDFPKYIEAGIKYERIMVEAEQDD